MFFFLGGWLIIGLSTPGLPLLDLGAWWGEVIVYQKAMIWVILWSATGFNESWGPLAFKFKPNTAGYRYWMRTGTLRLPPWPDKVPFTKGDERRAIDVALYAAQQGLLATRFSRQTNRLTLYNCLLYTSPSPRDRTRSRMPSSA